MLVQTYLDALQALPFCPLDHLVGTAPIVVLAPHPDDESLGCGGLIAAARQAGLPVHIVTMTDGSGSHPNSASHPPSALAAVRRAEARRAASLLGVRPDDLTHLDLKDAATPREGPAFDAAVAQIETLVRESRAETLLVTSGLDPHCDHQSAAAMAREVGRRHSALRLWFYPIWSWHLPPTATLDCGQPAGFRLDIASFAAAKHAAIAAHVSQMTDLIDDDPQGFHFTTETLAPFLRPYEVYIEATP